MRRWGTWQSAFRVSIRGKPKLGKPLQVACGWRGGCGGAIDEARFTAVEAPARDSWGRLCWDTADGAPALLLGASRCVEVAAVGRRRRSTSVRSSERFEGPLSGFVWLYRGARIRSGFEAFHADLIESFK